jgi:hypothetical protein
MVHLFICINYHGSLSGLASCEQSITHEHCLYNRHRSTGSCDQTIEVPVMETFIESLNREIVPLEIQVENVL